MSPPESPHQGYTIGDWKAWEGQWELIHGVPHAMTPSPSPEHQRTSSRLQKAIDAALEASKTSGGGACEVLSAPLDLFLPNEESVYQPDLIVDPVEHFGLLLRLIDGRYEEVARVEWGAVVVGLLGGRLPVALD